MAGRYDWYFRQPVASAEMDSADDGLENADRNLSVDLGAVLVDASTAIDGGVVNGLTVTTGALTLITAAGQAYDNNGQRVALAAPITVDVSQTGDTAIGAGGTPAGGVSTDPGAGNEIWISLYVYFARALSDPRTDGAGATVQFNRAESFRFRVTVGVAAPTGTAVRGAIPAGGFLLLGDILRNTAGFVGGFDTTRRQDWFARVTAATWPIRTIRRGRVRDALADLLSFYNNHARRDASTVDFHYAKNVDFESPGLTWAGPTGAPEAFGAFAAAAGVAGASLTSGVQGAIREIVSDVAGSGATSGAHRVGATAQTGSRPAGAVGAALSLAAGPLFDQLTALLSDVNRAVRLTGDTITGALVPNVSGVDLGSGGARFDVFANVLDVTTLGSNVSTGGTTRTIGNLAGAAGDRVDVGVNVLNVLGGGTLAGIFTAGASATFGTLLPLTTGASLGLGGANQRWASAVLEALDMLPANDTFSGASLRARVTGTARGPVAEFYSKLGVVTAVVDRMGHYRPLLPAFRDEFLYPTTTVFDASGWVTTTGGTGSTAGILSNFAGAMGVVSARCLRIAGDGATAGDAHVSTPGAVGGLFVNGTSADSRAHYIARVQLPEIALTTRRVWCGASSAFSTNVDVPSDFVGFTMDSGSSDWRFRVISGGVDRINVVVLTGTTAWTRLEFYTIDSTHMDASVTIEGGSQAHLTNQVLTGALPTSGVTLRFAIDTTENSVAKSLNGDNIEVWYG